MVIEGFAWNLGTLILGGAVTVFLLLVGHWAPWVSRLPRVKAYSYGTFSIWVGFALWRMFNRDWQTAVGLLLIVGLAGATVLVAYRIDRVTLAVRQAKKAEAGDAELSLPE
jgi:hypothetical protein